MAHLFPDEAQENAWLTALGQGDIAAFDAIYRFYSRSVFTAAYNYSRDSDKAQEVVQEVFVQLWERRQTLSVQGRLSHYLYGAARNQIYNLFKAEQRAARHATYLAQQTPVAENTTDEQVAFDEAVRLIQQHLDTLGETTRRVFLMSRFEGLTVRQIAEALGVTTKAVEYHITKALNALRVGVGHLPIAVVLLMIC